MEPTINLPAVDVEKHFSGKKLKGGSFKGQKLSGRSFAKQDLCGVDFSGTDIRGANFAGACLKGADFSQARSGLQRRWVAVHLVGYTILLTLTGLPLAMTGWWLTYFSLPSIVRKYYGLPLLFIILVPGILIPIVLRKGVEAALASIAVAGGITVGLTALLAAVGQTKIAIGMAVATATGAVGIGAALAGAAVVVGANVIGRTPSAVLVVSMAAISTGLVAGSAAARIAKTGGLDATVSIKEENFQGVDVALAALGAVSSIVISAFVSKRAFSERQKYDRILKMAIVLATLKGTNFREADLSDADFTGASLKCADLRGAIITRTCWRSASKLHWSRMGKSYLDDSRVRQLVIDGEGRKGQFDRLVNLNGLNLRGAQLREVNFEESILSDATLEGADLTESNLTGVNFVGAIMRSANLSKAKLIRAQLGGADLSNACLTGACIEDWNITTRTALTDIECEYVFMGLESEKRFTRRQPHDRSKNFVAGEFSEFISPMIQTLNLYHNDPVNPPALAVAFNRLTRDNPQAEIEVASFERRGKNRDKFLLRAFTSERANLSELDREYSEIYERLKLLSPDELARLVLIEGAKAKELRRLVDLNASRPTTQITMRTERGDSIVGDQYNIPGQAGAVGPNAHAHDNEFNQAVGQLEQMDLSKLAGELFELRQAMSQEAKEPTDYIVVGKVAEAEIAAKAKDPSKVVESLKGIGTWALEVASKIGTSLATEAIKQSLGMK